MRTVSTMWPGVPRDENLHDRLYHEVRAETFLTRLRNSGANRLIDARLNNVSPLAGLPRKMTCVTSCGRYATWHMPTCDCPSPHKIFLIPIRRRRLERLTSISSWIS